MQGSELAELRSMVIEAALHVLPTCGIQAKYFEGPPKSEPGAGQLAAFIGFSGELMRGTITLIAPFALMKHTYPLSLKEEDNWELEIFDWSAEVTNRLLGRVKTLLATRGVDVDPSTPKVLLADQLHLKRSMREPECYTFCFSAGEWNLQLSFDAITRGGAAVFSATTHVAGTPSEGEILLF